MVSMSMSLSSSNLWLRGVTALVLSLGLVACEDEDKGDDSGDGGSGDDGTPATTGMDDGGSTGDGGTDPSMWVVGEDGQMLRVADGEDVGRYPLDVAEDFSDIACRGLVQAWAVGGAGMLLATADAGTTWDTVSLSTTADLTAVAASDQGAVWVVGDGVAFVSPDEGANWSPASAPVVEWTSVATDDIGERAWLSGVDGSLWRVPAEGAATRLWAGSEALRDVAVSSDGAVVVAVGDLGTVVRSDDAGLSFRALPVPTVRDLDAVQVAREGGLTVAVGQAGVVLRIDFDAGITATELLDPSLVLHAVHVDAEGLGHAVGDAGTMLQTRDAGESWTAVELGTHVGLFGIDHPGALHL
jgi:photosystem II stability/assembly factor-like uncharacterized protein